jgi:cytochrome c553
VKVSVHALLAVVLAVGGAGAIAGVDVQAQSWAATCTGCHGTNGRSEGAIPAIAGLEKAYIVKVMREFRNDERPATVMHQHARGYTEDQIARIADFFSRQPRR